MFYFLNYAYNPNTAATNRALAYLKGLSELGIQTRVEFFLTDSSKSKISQDYPNLDIHYRWDKWYYINHKYLKHIFYVFSLLIFVLNLKKGDTVYMYNMADALHFVLKRKGIKVFVEKTEHPSMYPLGSHSFHPSMEMYKVDCTKASGIITVSTSLVKFFVEEAGVEKGRIKIVNMIVDDKRFCGVKPAKYEKPYFGYCGTISTFKDGVDILIKSFAQFCSKHSGYQLRIAGRFGTAEDERIITGLVKEYGLEESVVFVGLVSAAEMPSFLMGATAVVLSRPDNIQARNGFPGKLGEYLLSKSTIIVTAVGDIPLFVKDKVSGLIVIPDDVEEFAAALNWVVEHPEEATRLGVRGEQLARDHFNYMTETKKLVDFMGI